MKVLMGHFTAESNSGVRKRCEFKDFVYKTGSELIQAMEVGDIFSEAGIELIPTIYANGHAAGLVSMDAFKFITSELFRGVREHLSELDGIFLFLHGASSVEGLDGSSGEHYVLREIRKIVGDYLPIAVVMDPHGNVTEEFCSYANIVRSYRESPHTDRVETHRKVAKLFVDYLKRRSYVNPVIVKLPMMLGGERSVSLDEPVLTFNQMLNQAEIDPRIMSCSFHVGYLRHDDDKCGCAVVVVPMTKADEEHARNVCKKLSDYIWGKRHDFHFTGKVAEPEDALDQALDFRQGQVFITDSGDNQTSGAPGYNTRLLNMMVEKNDYQDKKILFASIADPKCVDSIVDKKIGEVIKVRIGVDEDVESKSLALEVEIVSIGEQHQYHHESENLGPAITVKIVGKPIYVILVRRSISYCEIQQFEAARLDINVFDVVVVKQGYLFPELKARAAYYVMALTDGATNQRSERIVYRRINRPMFPIDHI